MESMASKKKTKQNKVKELEEGQSIKQKVKVKGVSETFLSKSNSGESKGKHPSV